jgi:hypothetical protein
MTMAKEEKVRKPCHFCRKYNVETHVWKTSCGLKLDKDARKEHVLAEEWEYVTCKACKKEKLEDVDQESVPVLVEGRRRRNRERS